MKIFSRSAYLFFGLLIWVAAGSSVYAQTYVGEVCWLVQEAGEEEDAILKLAAVEVGDNHYTMSGVAFSADEGLTTESEFLNGSAEVISDQVIITLSGSSNNSDEILSVKYQVQLVIPSLNGAFEGVGLGYDKAGEETFAGYGSGSLTLTECPE